MQKLLQSDFQLQQQQLVAQQVRSKSRQEEDVAAAVEAVEEGGEQACGRV